MQNGIREWLLRKDTSLVADGEVYRLRWDCGVGGSVAVLWVGVAGVAGVAGERSGGGVVFGLGRGGCGAG